MEEDGEIGFAVIEKETNPKVEIQTLNDWKEQDKKLGKELESLVKSIFWTGENYPLPGRPDIEHDDPRLFKDILAFNENHIWHQDSGYFELLTNWELHTYLSEFLSHSPRLLLYGPTKSGKTRVMDVVRAVSRRAFVCLDPTKAGLFRLAEKFIPTMLIDEYQRLSAEKRSDIDVLYTGGFEKGGTVTRVNESGAVDFFHVYSPFAISAKDRLPPEDLQNRAVMIGMMLKPKKTEIEIRRRIDFKAATRLRTRCIAMRLKAFAGAIDMKPIIEQAWITAEKAIDINQDKGKNGILVSLDDRAIEIAANLIIPGLIFPDSYNKTLRLVANSQAESDQELENTISGQVFHALQAVLRSKKKGTLTDVDEFSVEIISSICTRDIAQQLNQDLVMQGNLNERDPPIKTRTVRQALFVMGFQFNKIKKTHNQTYLDGKTFKAVFESNLSKYGSDKGVE
jgi:hypothetical protein